MFGLELAVRLPVGGESARASMDRRHYLAGHLAFCDAGVLRGLSARSALASTVARDRDGTAYIDGGLRLRWSELAARVDRFAAELGAAGIGPGDVVGVHLPNSVAFAIAHLALAEAGAVTLPLHLPYGSSELRALLAQTRAVACIAPSSEIAAKIAPLRDMLGRLRVLVAADLDDASFAFDGAAGGPRTRPASIDPDQPFVLAATSGTESPAPKLCMHGHDGLLSNACAFVDEAALDSGDTLIVGSGFTHLFGLLGVHVGLLCGAAMITLRKFDAPAYLALAERERATRAWAVPAQLVDLVLAARAAAPALALREVRTAGAVVGAAFVHDVRDALGAPVTVHWGMTEIGGGITSYGRDLTRWPSALGTPLPGAQVRIARGDGTEAACDEVGELWYRRADMFRGYYRDEAQTGAAIAPDGWLRTGDLAARDAAGIIHYHGRAKDLVNRGGFKIGAAEIEAHVAALPAIRRCALVAVPDLRLGERACLVAELQDGATLTLDDVTALLDRDGIAKYKWPEHLVLVDAMPMTATNKIAKSTVRALASQRVAAGAAVHA